MKLIVLHDVIVRKLYIWYNVIWIKGNTNSRSGHISFIRYSIHTQPCTILHLTVWNHEFRSLQS